VLLELVRSYRQARAGDVRSDADLLRDLAASLTIDDDTPGDRAAIACALAMWLRLSDCDGAASLLRDAGVGGDFDLTYLDALRRDPAFAQVKDLLDSNDRRINEALYNRIRSLAIEAGGVVG